MSLTLVWVKLKELISELMGDAELDTCHGILFCAVAVVQPADSIVGIVNIDDMAVKGCTL